jgi:hypothetical protein
VHLVHLVHASFGAPPEALFTLSHHCAPALYRGTASTYKYVLVVVYGVLRTVHHTPCAVQYTVRYMLRNGAFGFAPNSWPARCVPFWLPCASAGFKKSDTTAILRAVPFCGQALRLRLCLCLYLSLGATCSDPGRLAVYLYTVPFAAPSTLGKLATRALCDRAHGIHSPQTKWLIFPSFARLPICSGDCDQSDPSALKRMLSWRMT